MEPRHSGRLSISSWIFVLFLSFVCSCTTTPKLELDNSVFVAFQGENLSVKCTITNLANCTTNVFQCFNTAKKSFYSQNIDHTSNPQETKQLTVQLINVSSSGLYYCTFENIKVDWFVRVRAKGYKEVVKWDYTECITVATFTGLLLLFSVFGSVYVFRGHWAEMTTKCDNTKRTEKQNSEDRKKTEIEEDNMDMTVAQSTSFYASLEPRSRSIYEVLDRSAAKTESEQNETKSKKKDPRETVVQAAENQAEDKFESVYENF
ncbi:uncharacterized protein si:ch211-243a20.4 [Kryptolebias marmoratus]|uniref:uncharacterized protein si:ch211-243a20.4 n=1 Tax=Kryptolebias marmoratus TaxID=37003 RepID=UPI0007F9388A|nr:uncharacterized protein si:ch211-243a20.4 [Kryptolebias marmoratus]